MLGIIIPHLEQAEKYLQDSCGDKRTESTNVISVSPTTGDASRDSSISNHSTNSVNKDISSISASVNPDSLDTALKGNEDEGGGIETEKEAIEDDGNGNAAGDDSGGCKDNSSEGGGGNKDDNSSESSGGNKDDDSSESSEGKDDIDGDGVKKAREKRFAYVYLIWSESMDFVKFGRSNSLASRFRKRYQTVRILYFK